MRSRLPGLEQGANTVKLCRQAIEGQRQILVTLFPAGAAEVVAEGAQLIHAEFQASTFQGVALRAQ